MKTLYLPICITYQSCLDYLRSFRFPIPDSRFPIPDSLFPIPDSRFPIPNSQFPAPFPRQ
ncbi:MAG: hypothetical protein F6K56_38145 [Moorea sp. SIO3G5]|nr:hypothetical protein [Moorena sp. SIO3G5]